MKIFKIIYYIFIAFIAAVALLLIISVLPITGNFKVLTVLSGSMEPDIKTGSVVVVKPVDNYKIEDIITFTNSKKPDESVTHRIYDMKVNEGVPVYITKGDANNVPDTREIREKDIIGKVLLDIPYLGYAVNFAKKPLGFALIIIVPAMIIIGDEIRKIYGELKKKKTNETE
ncbi:signal peptidase I [Candidatus Parcubacteria bacterium]|nr:signal peptidase I [Candidatus Parcubacteria bacterium]